MKEEKVYYGIGEVLKQLRINRNLTQINLAEKLNVSINAIKQYETNKREPRYDYLLKICDFFNVSPDFLKTYNHYYLEDIKQYNDCRIIPQSKSINREINTSILLYKKFLDSILKKNNNSAHVLFLIKSMNSILEDISKIALNKKKDYLLLDDTLYDNMEDRYMYLEGNASKIRQIPLSKFDAYVNAEKNFNDHIKNIEENLRKVFLANFEEDYKAYRSNFKRKAKYLENNMNNEV